MLAHQWSDTNLTFGSLCHVFACLDYCRRHTSSRDAHHAAASPEFCPQLLEGLFGFLGVLDEEEVLLLQVSIDLQEHAGLLEVHGLILLLPLSRCRRCRLLHSAGSQLMISLISPAAPSVYSTECTGLLLASLFPSLTAAGTASCMQARKQLNKTRLLSSVAQLPNFVHALLHCSPSYCWGMRIE